MRVVIVSEQPLFLDALEQLVRGDLEAEAVAGAARLDTLDELEADLALFDLPHAAAPEAWIAAAAGWPAMRRALIIPDRDAHLARVARANGFSAVLPKTIDRAVWGPALKLVLAGGEYFPCFDDPIAPRAAAAPSMASLSPRQNAVLRELAIGRTNKEIALALGISIATVKLHVQSILTSIGARNRTEAALRYLRSD